MTDPVALVTGAARGIGAATVEALCSAGWNVVAVDVCADDPALDYRLGTRAELAAVVAAAGTRAVDVVGDVRDLAAMHAAVELARERFGRLDALIGAAGVLWGGRPAWETPDDAWRVQMDVNVTGVWHLAVAGIPALLDATATSPVGHPSFVAVSSAAGTRGLPQLAGYAASKHAVIGLVQSMAAELGDAGVTANVVCPGSTRTPILDASARVYGLGDRNEFAAHHLLPRLIEPAEVAAMISFLCGPDARAITGAALAVDAGMNAH